MEDASKSEFSGKPVPKPLRNRVSQESNVYLKRLHSWYSLSSPSTLEYASYSLYISCINDLISGYYLSKLLFFSSKFCGCRPRRRAWFAPSRRRRAWGRSRWQIAWGQLRLNNVTYEAGIVWNLHNIGLHNTEYSVLLAR